MKRLSLLAFLLIVNIAGAEKAPVSIRGTITEIGGNGFLVEGKKEADTSYDKASVTILKKTTILRVEGELLKEAKADDLKKGMRVEVTFVGPVRESYPVQADARKIVILPPNDKKPNDDPKK